MKNKDYVKELEGKTKDELSNALVDAKKELFNLRFRNATNQLDNTAEIKAARRNIARIQTVLSVKQRAEA
ncbi:MAG: 50S ribosomal protein L29 [Lachnospiraceae bacterium]|nr:50S ribosomal protein L29 [Lachnospiraceae bacterium]MCR4936953.1 50S ribosomal protein L29 [Lachnospiraceae bacterium]